MVTKCNHIAIISSSEASIAFYEKLGFQVTRSIDRTYDKLFFLECAGTTLEIFVDPSHPARADRPEAMGLRHIAFDVDSIEKTVLELGVQAEPIRESFGQRVTFVKDPDFLPIELREFQSPQKRP